MLSALLSFSALLGPAVSAQIPTSSPESIGVLIVDGQNNHDFNATTRELKTALVSTGRFRVRISRSPGKDAPAKAWDGWRPRFGDFHVVVCDYNGQLWPEPVRKSFEDFVQEGGGVVFVHAANNAFRTWKAYNVMIGLGWRGHRFGKRVTIDAETGKTIITPPGQGPGAGHGPQHPFVVEVREPSHPIMKGLPRRWLHAKDELYHGQRGPAKNMTVLSSALSSKTMRGTGAHEPITWVVRHGKGRCVVTVMGHHWRGQKDFDALRCVGFRTVFVRSVEWVATGRVTIPVPKAFPSLDKISVRAPG